MNCMRCGILLDDFLKRFPHNFQSEHQLTTYRSCIIAIWKVLLGFMILPSKLKMINCQGHVPLLLNPQYQLWIFKVESLKQTLQPVVFIALTETHSEKLVPSFS